MSDLLSEKCGQPSVLRAEDWSEMAERICARRMPLGSLAELSFLVEWYEAAQAAQAAALNLRDWFGVDEFDAMADEAGAYLDMYHSNLAEAA